ncbi:MAG: NAD(P)-binding domain-containing protein [Candidatus Paceibacterota bacterium]|jgi:hypothetical protein
MTTITFKIPGLSKKFIFKSPRVTSPFYKKKCRLEIAKHLPPTHLALHACLLRKNNKGTLLIGPTQSGKSTMAKLLVDVGYQIIANDFVAVTYKKGQLWASDINYEINNKFLLPISVDYIFTLDPKNKLDISRMTKSEFDKFYTRTLSPIPEKFTKLLIEKPVYHHLFRRHVCLGNRKDPEKWMRSIKYVLSIHLGNRVGIFGLGAIGQGVANLLIDHPGLTELHLYTRDKSKLSSFVLDLKSANPKMTVVGHNTTEEFFANCDIVILCFRDSGSLTSVSGTEERVARLFPHARIVWDISRVIRKCAFSGVFLMVSNPVDILSSALYEFSWLDDSGKKDNNGIFSNQIYGVGLGLDYNRLLVIKTGVKYEVVGPHGDNLQLAKINNGVLVPAIDKELLSSVLDYSKKIRVGCSRTIEGPTHEIQKIISVLISGKGILRASGLYSSDMFLGNIWNIKKLIPEVKFSFNKKLKDTLDSVSIKQTDILYLTEKELLNDVFKRK